MYSISLPTYSSKQGKPPGWDLAAKMERGHLKRDMLRLRRSTRPKLSSAEARVKGVFLFTDTGNNNSRLQQQYDQ